ncbi:acetamidase/formamidase family protein [Bradyrhizobium erythrophlei]|uniref:acetamidase/formamidase family protein n=1 Tax=Bradyrhizobium erythrophlei TaxID=1437360 RepID=UPI0035E790D5
MSETHGDGSEHAHHHPDHHVCANLFGCGDEKGTGIVREDIKDAAFDDRARDALLHMDEVDKESFDGYLSARGHWRRKFLQASSFMGALAAVEPWFARLARAQESGAIPKRQSHGGGRVHVVPSTKETVRLGVFDANLAPILTIDSGDIISFPDTWSHFLNEMQPGVTIDTLAKLRVDNPGKGPHSIIGPIAVNKAEPGDVLEIRYERIRPYQWGAVFNNPGALGTGLLPQDYAQGQVKYVDLDLRAMTARLLPNITIPLKPFQGTFGVAPPDGYFPPLSPGVTSSVPPGPHAGNLDLSDLSEGSTLYIPVWKPGALIYTGDSHAVQGDGEISLTALETRLKELRVQVILHKQKNLAWPVAETDSHWIIIGLDKDLNAAMALAARNAIKFLAARARISELDAYALCSVAVSFRVTQVVDIVRGVHALIPKTIFASQLRREMTVV